MAKWKKAGGRLKQTFEFPNFAAAMVFVNKVADAAETADHHPDITINYNKVMLELWTHSEKKVTDKDEALAKQISELYEQGSVLKEE